MEKLDDEAAAKFISALTKSVQTLCHGFLDFHTGVEILGYINLNVDKGSKLHYVLEEKVCKNEENSTLFISNSFHAQNQKQDKGKDSESESSGSTGAHRSNSTDNGERSRVSSAISSISTALSRSHEKFPLDSTSSAKDAADMVQSRPISNTSKRKASDDLNSDIRSAKSSHMRSSPSPVSHFLSHSQSPHGRTGRTSPIDRKPSVSELRGENSSGTVLPQTAGISGDGAGDLGVNLAGSVLERVDDHSNSDLPDRGDDSDGDLEVTFIKEEYMEGEQSSCQFENSTGQFGRGTNRRASSTDNMPDASLYPISLHPSASATYVPGSQDMASAQHYGPSTSSQPGASGVRGHFLGDYRPWHGPEMSSDSAIDLTRNVMVSTSRHLSASEINSTSQDGSMKFEARSPTDDSMEEANTGNQGEFKCRYCAVPPYKHKGSLKRHIKLFHMDQPVFRCQICSMGFMYKDHYVGHLNKHFNKATFQCTHCPKKFIYKGDMYNHRKKCHGSSAELAVDPSPEDTVVSSEESFGSHQENTAKEQASPPFEDNV
ncbi:dentin sialophosphoprotein-like isoform X3 [Littorina saxatilis]|uniref:dentin sialophosphoprotein-like isoform X3 n=1 Tax=Littorina saxatilis TaxID=31220 RepID=UPI0038B61F2F